MPEGRSCAFAPTGWRREDFDTAVGPVDLARVAALPPEQMVRVCSGGIGRHVAEFHPVRDLFGRQPD